MADSFITGATLAKSQDSVKSGQPLTLSLSFKVEGAIREAFTQKTGSAPTTSTTTAFG